MDANQTDTEALARNVRGRIFADANMKRKSEVIQFFGEAIELRQPSLGDISRMNEEGGQQTAIVSVLINYAFIPGTDERVFDDVHADELLKLPFDENFVRVGNVVKTLTGGSVSEAKND